jgi:hypothetical protein
MKIEKKTISNLIAINEKEFEPFKLIFDIETIEEAIKIYALFNHTHNLMLFGRYIDPPIMDIKNTIGKQFYRDNSWFVSELDINYYTKP